MPMTGKKGRTKPTLPSSEHQSRLFRRSGCLTRAAAPGLGRCRILDRRFICTRRRFGRHMLIRRLAPRDGRRQRRQVQSTAMQILVDGIIIGDTRLTTRGGGILVPAATGPLRALVPFRTLAPLSPLIAAFARLLLVLTTRAPLGTLLLLLNWRRPEAIVAIIETLIAVIGAIVGVGLPFIIATKALLLLFLPGTIISKHTEIMVRELKIIFHVHTIARELGITREVAVFFQKLCGVAPRTAVDPVSGIPVTAITPTVLPRVVTTATAVRLTIVDQRVVLVLRLDTSVATGLRSRSKHHSKTAESATRHSRPDQ